MKKYVSFIGVLLAAALPFACSSEKELTTRKAVQAVQETPTPENYLADAHPDRGVKCKDCHSGALRRPKAIISRKYVAVTRASSGAARRRDKRGSQGVGYSDLNRRNLSHAPRQRFAC